MYWEGEERETIMRIRRGEMSDLSPVLAQVEEIHTKTKELLVAFDLLVSQITLLWALGANPDHGGPRRAR